MDPKTFPSQMYKPLVIEWPHLLPQTGKTKTIRRTAVQETGVSWHDERPIEPPRTLQHDGIEGALFDNSRGKLLQPGQPSDEQEAAAEDGVTTMPIAALAGDYGAGGCQRPPAVPRFELQNIHYSFFFP